MDNYLIGTWWLFGTRDLNRDSVIQIYNHWIPLKKMMFGTRFFSEDWNPNLNFMWVPCQFWVQPFTCFWIQAGFKSGLNSCGSQFITVTGPTFFFSPHFLSLSSSVSLLLSLALGHYRARTPLPSSPRAPYSLSSLLSAKPPHRSSLLQLPTFLFN